MLFVPLIVYCYEKIQRIYCVQWINENNFNWLHNFTLCWDKVQSTLDEYQCVMDENSWNNQESSMTCVFFLQIKSLSTNADTALEDFRER